MSRTEYFVIDGKGMLSFKHDEPECFGTFNQAIKRARELAKSEPGHAVAVTQSIALVTCEIAPAKIEMRERKLRNNGGRQ
jgi:hypothetical protein